ncbi:MAG: cyclase family protein [Clostridia bacterium]|nr:cyclase family protein [Clostridia bacterium]MBQ5820040.1 cyclase family protein [Clostridia bacterium]
MKIYDISQEVFGCVVFPGDPAPERTVLCSMERGDLYNLTQFSMCAHNGTHLDAPAHFLRDGDTVDAIPLTATVGKAFVADFDGLCTAADAEEIMRRAASHDPEGAKRILLKGKTTVSLEAAQVFAEAGILLIGNESQTVGPEDAPMQVHLVLLGAGVILLEGIRLSHVPEGGYLLSAAPLCLGGAEGAPCRAVLIDG